MPSHINTAEPTAALIRAFRLQGDFRPTMDEVVSPVVLIGRLDGGPASLWPRTLSEDWRGATVSINTSFSPITWWRFRSPVDRPARLERLRMVSMSGSGALLALFRGDLQSVIGGAQGTFIPGVWTDDLERQANAFTPPPNSTYGLNPMTGGANITFTGQPAAILRIGGNTYGELNDLGIDCPAGGVISVVPLLGSVPGTAQQYRHEAVVTGNAITLAWREEF